MAKRLIFFCCLFFALLSSPAWADEWVCYGGYQIEDEEQNVAPAEAMPNGSDEGATSDSQLFFDFSDLIQPYTNYPTYEDGMPADQYISWASRYLNKVLPGQKYVFARTGQYQYIMAVGDFDDSFVGSATVYILNLARSGYDYSYVVLEDSNFSLNVGSNLVYSSVDGWPSLPGYDRSSDLLLLSAIVICAWFGLRVARLVFSPLLGWR